jgi:osmotically-inducible protein OsmY
MDKHYGWQEGGSQGQGRPRNGQQWHEGDRDDRNMRGQRGGESDSGWEQDERRWTSSGGDLDREGYVRENQEAGGQPRRNFGGGWPSHQPRFSDEGRWSQGGGSEGFRGQGQGYGNQRYGNQGFSGGHYGGFSNEGSPAQGGFGGQRGFPNEGDYGQRFGQGALGRNRGFAGQSNWNQSGGWGQGTSDYSQTFGRGYAGEVSRGQDFSGPGYGGQGYASRGSTGRGFSGRGPKGYQRSDDRIKEQLSDRLMDDDDIDATEISIDVKNGEVTLTGTVNSREEKRAAEDIAEQSPGVREVQNHLRVSHDSSSAQSGQSGQSGRAGMSASSSRQDSTSKAQDSTSGQSKSRNERE